MPGPFIPIDSIDAEPSMYRFYRRLSSFCRVIRFDHRGMGMSSRIGRRTRSRPACWAEDAVAVMDAVGCERATIFASGFTAMSALFLAADHPERVSSLVIVNGGGTRAVGARLRGRAREPSGADAVHHGGDRAGRRRAGFRRPRVRRAVGVAATRRSARGGTPRATAPRHRAWPARSNQALADADARDKLPLITAPTLILHRDRLDVRRGRARPVPRRAHRRRPLRRVAGRRHAVLGRRHHADPRRDRGVHHRRAWRLRRRTRAHHDRVHRHRRLDRARRRARRRPLARPARQPRQRRSATSSSGSAAAKSTRPATDSSRRSSAPASRSTARRPSSTRSGRSASRCGSASTRARSRCAATTSRAWPCTSARASRRSPGPSEVLVSSTVREIVTGSRRTFADRGEYELKGVPGTLVAAMRRDVTLVAGYAVAATSESAVSSVVACEPAAVVRRRRRR